MSAGVKTKKFVVVGGGIAGVTCAEQVSETQTGRTDVNMVYIDYLDEVKIEAAKKIIWMQLFEEHCPRVSIKESHGVFELYPFSLRHSLRRMRSSSSPPLPW